MSVHSHKLKANALWQKDKLQWREVNRGALNTINTIILNETTEYKDNIVEYKVI